VPSRRALDRVRLRNGRRMKRLAPGGCDDPARGDRNIIVVDGVAHVWGLVGSPSERKALIVLAEGVPGVTGVRDEMIPAYQ
jgi:hypothetical protein